MSYLGIDFGSKRIGLALAEHATLVLPLKTVICKGAWLEELKRCLQDYEIKVVVIGLPLNMDGSEGDAAKRVRQFAKQLENHCEAQIELWDERLSSVEAHDRLSQAGLTQKQQRGIVDQMAATIILQSYLDAQTQKD